MTGFPVRPAPRAVLAVVAVLSLATACTHGTAARGHPASMAGYLDGLAASGQFTGTVLAARSGQVLLDAGYGLADRATRTLNGPATIFQIGSVTKQFTAMAIAILAQRGDLRLNAQACGYLPGCPRSWHSRMSSSIAWYFSRTVR